MSKRLFTAASYGIIASFIIILLTALILTTILKITSMSETTFGQIPMLIISLIALFIGGVVAGAKMKEKGLITGASTGLTYSVLIYLILYLGYDHGLGADQYLTIFVNIIVTGMGGIIGVNFFQKK